MAKVLLAASSVIAAAPMILAECVVRRLREADELRNCAGVTFCEVIENIW